MSKVTTINCDNCDCDLRTTSYGAEYYLALEPGDELRKILTHNAGRLPERLEQDVAAIIELIEDVIGPDMEYHKNEFCPVCAQRQYSCSCADAVNLRLTAQRQRLNPTQIKKEEK